MALQSAFERAGVPLMSKNVIDGKLVALSPSMLNAFDPKTSFGCERRAWFKYVAGLPEPVTGNQQLGTDLHKLIEHRLTTGKDPESESEAAGLYLAGKEIIEKVASRKILHVEGKLEAFELAEVPVKGFIDVVTEDGIVDWKTSSNINRYGKTAEQLAKDTQMLIYARAMHSARDSVLLAHGQFQTKGTKRANWVEVEITKEQLDTEFNKVIIPLVERVKEVVSFTNSKQATPDRDKCFNCAFRGNQCLPEGESTVMSFFSKFQHLVVVPTTAEDTLHALEKSIEIVNNILPPDASKSDPALASEAPKLTQAQVEVAKANDATVAAEKARSRGRPPGAKNKPKEVEASVVVAEPPTAEVPQHNPVNTCKAPCVVKATTVSKGFTVNIGQFNSVRFDVSVTVEGNDADVNFVAAMGEVTKRLNDEAEKYDSEVAKGTTVPAKGSVVK